MPLNSNKLGLPGWLILMGALTAIGPVSIDMYLPAFPSIATGLNATHSQVERTLAIYLIGMSVAQLAYGPLADRYGRKPPLYGALSLYIVASAGCAIAPNIEVLTASRLLQAMGGAAGMVISRAVVRDHYDTQEAARALSMLMLIMGVAP
ncbi:MAG TPA: Bcr/CflA family drug resistance efflux transporter, partial [Alcaligenaceae bacterium]|nr:Bcr/CflA family drug resistance efflux transporter [Alcaligenaceae bacterium]